ncbi:Protein F09A5.2, partial [Aphelenchoides avenae]
PGKDWKQKCNLTKLESSQFRVKTHSSLTELVRSIAKPCPLTGILSTTRPLSTSTRSSTLHSSVSPYGGSGGTISKGALIAIICASVFTGCVLAFALYCVFRRKCSNDSRFFGGPKVAPRFPVIPVIAPSFQPSKEAIATTDQLDSIDPWEVDEKHLLVNEDEILGAGAFAIVCKGYLAGRKPMRGTSWRFNSLKKRTNEVAVKRLKKHADEYFRDEFMREIEFMKTLGSHPHVLQMVGYLRTDEKTLLLLEYCADGDLLTLLREHRECVTLPTDTSCLKESPTCVRLNDMMSYAWQVADGMTYLSAKKFIHRDLAARNVLVNQRCLKIADFGLTRYSDDSLYTTKAGRLPIKWMSPEALKRAEFSTASDVWSFGVLLYEVFSAGNMPYPVVHPSEMLAHLEEGERLERPEHASDQMYGIMRQCWSLEPAERPSFSRLRSDIQAILEATMPSYGYLQV